MNLVLLVEGDRTEPRVLRAWLRILAPATPEVERKEDFSPYRSAYYILSSGGVGSIEMMLRTEIREAADFGVDVVIVLRDAGEEDAAAIVTDLHNIANDEFSEAGIEPDGLRVDPHVAQHCIETWLLGNRRAYPRQPDDETLREYQRYFNVSTLDPEQMDLPPTFAFSTRERFHFDYLRRMIAARGSNSYTKRRPGPVLEPTYFAELQSRVEDTNHLATLRRFLTALQDVLPSR
jgi:hypothetical protein